MSGDASNAHLWQDANVYVSFNTAASAPADIDTDFGIDWELVGLLDGDAGFVETRDEDVNDHFAWGGILMRTSRAHFKLSRKFTSFEWNDTTRRLRWPHSNPGEIIVPRPERVLVAFETIDQQSGVTHRVITAGGPQAEITIDGDITENETDMNAFSWLVTIYPDADGLLFVEQETAEGS